MIFQRTANLLNNMRVASYARYELMLAFNYRLAYSRIKFCQKKWEAKLRRHKTRIMQQDPL